MRPALLLLCCLFSTLLGMLYASRLKSRIRELKGLERMAMLIRQEIAYGRLPLPDIFGRLGRRMEKPQDYVISGTNIRHRLVIMTKISETPKKYPRTFAKIKKNPL